jgi:hypothetical protein
MTNHGITLNELVNSPLFSTLAGVMATAMVGAFVVLIRIAMQFARLQSSVNEVNRRLESIVNDKDVIRWSTLQGRHTGGGNTRG